MEEFQSSNHDIEANNNYNNNNSEDITTIGDEKGDEFVGTPVQKFYAGQKIFITGATGFLGKVLIEKLLRSCPNISKIYVLIRSKKGKSLESRLEDLFQDPVFDRLREVLPNFRDKIVPVSGDCCVKGLDISKDNVEILTREVSIVFHVAATVRFDEELKLALEINVRSTGDVVSLCEKMPNLKAFIHVSTAYANCHLKQIDERFYDYPIGHEELLKLAETLPEDVFQKETSKYIQHWPNTYTVTKAIAESLVREKCHNVPAGIFRPAIVISTSKEPVSGWIDNLYGPTGLVAAGISGLLKIIHVDPDAVADLVPVDLTVNALIVSAWDVHTQTHRRGKDALVYNYVSSVESPLTWGQFENWSYKAALRYPLKNCMWYPSYTVIKNKALYVSAIIFAHFLPAILVDFASLCLRRKPRLWKIYSKLHKYSNAISHFSTNQWSFTNDNVRAMWRRTSEKDKLLFDFDIADFEWKNFFYHYVLGVRRYIFKDDLSSLPECRIKQARLFWLNKAVLTVLALGLGTSFWMVLAAFLKKS